MEIPYTTHIRPDTGMYNGKLGVWLFIASGAMLFGGLFSAYVFLRNGSESWPNAGELLNVTAAAVGTFVLIASSITAALGWSTIRSRSRERFRFYFAVTVLLGAVFIGIKLFEFYELLAAEHYPKTSNFYAIFYVLTGVHALHVLGASAVVLFHVSAGRSMWDAEPERFINRVEVTGLYWHFVVLLWLIMFPALYLV